MALTLVTGPVRSGKSRFVVARAQASGKIVRYVATALRDPSDMEWSARIKRHEHDRPAHWGVVESATLAHNELLELFRSATADQCIIVDALGTWIGARVGANIDRFNDDIVAFEAALDGEAEAFAAAMLASLAEVIVVAEEVGWDVVPANPSARLFRDVLGRMKQRLATGADAVYLVVCGYALDIASLGARL